MDEKKSFKWIRDKERTQRQFCHRAEISKKEHHFQDSKGRLESPTPAHAVKSTVQGSFQGGWDVKLAPVRSRHCWCFGLRNTLCWRTGVCTVRCLAALPASVHCMLASTFFQVMTIENILRHCQMSPQGWNWPTWRPTGLDTEVISGWGENCQGEATLGTRVWKSKSRTCEVPSGSNCVWWWWRREKMCRYLERAVTRTCGQET